MASDQALIVLKEDNAIHRINHYPVDSVVCFVNTYPLDSVIQPLNNQGQAFSQMDVHVYYTCRCPLFKEDCFIFHMLLYKVMFI